MGGPSEGFRAGESATVQMSVRVEGGVSAPEFSERVAHEGPIMKSGIKLIERSSGSMRFMTVTRSMDEVESHFYLDVCS